MSNAERPTSNEENADSYLRDPLGPPCEAPPETVCISSQSRYVPRSFMAKTSWINRNERKRATVKKYAALRAELKAKKDYMGLSQLPRDASPTRVVNRCEVSGRRRAFIRRFKISRLTFRELASGGFIPGVTKSSW
jgi:small subunit ribosomal protein S14